MKARIIVVHPRIKLPRALFKHDDVQFFPFFCFSRNASFYHLKKKSKHLNTTALTTAHTSRSTTNIINMQRLDASDVVGLCNDELYRRYCAFPGVYSAPHDLDDLDLPPPGEEEESADPEKVAKRLAEREEGTALYHACEAQYFHSQLPLTGNADSSVSSSSLWSKSKQHENRRKKKTYVSKEFAHIGSTEACSSLRAMKKKLNECHKDEEGFFYIVQLRTERLNGDVEIVLDEYRNKVENESTSEEEDRGEHQENVDEKVNESNDNTNTNTNTIEGDDTEEEKEEEDDDDDDDDDDENDGNINEEFVRINGTINVEAITKIWIVRRAGAYGMSGKFTCVDPPMISIDDF